MGWLPSTRQSQHPAPHGVKASAAKETGLSAADLTRASVEIQALSVLPANSPTVVIITGAHNLRKLLREGRGICSAKISAGHRQRYRGERWVPAKELSLKRWNGEPPRLRGETRSIWSRFRMSVPLSVFRRLPTATGYERRYEYLGYASVYPATFAAVDPAGIQSGTKNLQRYRQRHQQRSVCRTYLGRGNRVVLRTRSSMIPRRNWRSHFDIYSTGVKASANLFRKPPPISSWLNAIIRPPMNVLPRWVTG